MRLQNVVRGEEMGPALEAAVDLLAGLIGVAATDRDHADKLVDALCGDVRRGIAHNWDELRQSRASAMLDLIAEPGVSH